jgi:hypothetical protein
MSRYVHEFRRFGRLRAPPKGPEERCMPVFRMLLNAGMHPAMDLAYLGRDALPKRRHRSGGQGTDACALLASRATRISRLITGQLRTSCRLWLPGRPPSTQGPQIRHASCAHGFEGAVVCSRAVQRSHEASDGRAPAARCGGFACWPISREPAARTRQRIAWRACLRTRRRPATNPHQVADHTVVGPRVVEVLPFKRPSSGAASSRSEHSKCKRRSKRPCNATAARECLPNI